MPEKLRMDRNNLPHRFQHGLADSEMGQVRRPEFE
jgi:hypothetical protein